jgi:hypothetical protein
MLRRRQMLLPWSVLLVLALMATGCPSPDQATDPDDPDPNDPGTPPPPPPPPAVSFDNRVLLFLIPTSSSTSTSVPELGITLETNFQYLFRVVPSLNKVDQVERNSSPSFAPSSKTFYSTDDRIFVAQEFRAFEVSGRTDLHEHSYDTFQKVRERVGLPPISHSQGCAAVVGDTYYFRRNRNFDVLSGDVGGEFYRTSLSSTTAPQQLIAFNSTANCFGYLMSTGGALYDVLASPKDRPASVLLYRRNLTTGLPENTPLVSLSESSPALYVANGSRYAVNDGAFYVLRRRVSGNGVEIWRQAIGAAQGTQPTKVFDQVVGFNPQWFEVDDGQVMMASSGGQALLWNMSTDQRLPASFGTNITAITQLYVRR